MPELPNPFVGQDAKYMSDKDDIHSVLTNIIAECEAIFLYSSYANKTKNSKVKKVYLDLKKEEEQHMGELLTLLNELQPDFNLNMLHGMEEVDQMLSNLQIKGLKRKDSDVINIITNVMCTNMAINMISQ